MELIGLTTRYVLQALLVLCLAIAIASCGQEKGDRPTDAQEKWYEYYTQAMLLRHEPDHSPADVLSGLHKAADYAQKELKPNSSSYVRTVRALAKQYEKMGDFEKSESLLLETYQIMVVDKNHNVSEYRSQPLQDLIKFYDRRGEPEKKQKYLDEMKELHAPFFEGMSEAELSERREAAAQRQAERSPCPDKKLPLN